MNESTKNMEQDRNHSFEGRITPTEEMAELPINGALIPARVWEGTTQSGLKIVMFVLSIAPMEKTNISRAMLELELPDYFNRTKDVCEIAVPKDDPFDPYTCPECQRSSEQCTCIWHDTGRGYFVEEQQQQQEEEIHATHGN